jgi:hypothetical protein
MKRNLQACWENEAGLSRSCSLRLLQKLHEAGALNCAKEDVPTKKSSQTRSARHSSISTPYGALQQTMSMDNRSPMTAWPYINPFAMIHELSRVCEALADLMAACVSAANGKPLEIVLYADGFVPGNPLRPDAGRGCVAFYWTFANFPQRVLQNAEAWFTVGVVRKKLLKTYPGGLSGFMRPIFKMFFSTSRAISTPAFLSSMDIFSTLFRRNIWACWLTRKLIKC